MVRAATERGKRIKVIVTETRPATQGSRLTAYELMCDRIPFTLIPDTAVGHCMALGKVTKVLVGADRVTTTGHVFNKIGTYQIALIAQKHGVPFYPAAPKSSFDLASDWRSVIIEERSAAEVTHISGRRIAPSGAEVFNPAFDVTPPELVSAIITELGIVRPPFEAGIAEIIGAG